MPRKRRDEEIVLGYLKQFARDKNCPWAFRVYCVYVLAVVTKMISETAIPPGVNKYRPREIVPPVAEQPPDDSSQPMDMSDFVKQLHSGGADGKT
jgi:hypothetical protein